MSKQEKKHEKFSCIANCLPMKGCFHKGKRIPSKIPTDNHSVAYNLTVGKEKQKIPFEENANEEDSARTEHMKQWLANLSTMVEVDPSYLDDSQLDGMDKTLTEQNGPDAAVLTELTVRSVQSGAPPFCQRPGTARHGVDENYHAACHDNRRGGCCANGKCAAGSFVSSLDCDSSHLSSNCCSQQPTSRRRRRRPERNCSITSTSTVSRSCQETYDEGDTSSIYSGSSSTISLATELVTLDLDACRHLGITIVGHSNAQGDCGIFVGCVKKGGAAAQNGRIEPGDLILEVNDIDLEHLSNENALSVLKSELARGGIVKILLAKYWDMNDGDRGEAVQDGAARQEPLYEAVGSVRSAASSARRAALVSMDGRGPTFLDGRNAGPLTAIPEDGGAGSRARMFREAAGMSSSELAKLYDLSKAAQACSGSQARHSAASSSSSVHTGYPDSGYHDLYAAGGGSVRSLPQHSSTVDRRLRSAASSGPQAGCQPRPFRGIELIDWIEGQVSGLKGRKDARLYAQNLLRTGYIYCLDPASSQHVSDESFQEHYYYAFGKQPTCSSVEALQSKLL